MMCVSNLQNLPWKITGKAHKNRTMSSGNRCFLDTGGPGILEKQQRRQQQSNVNTSESKVHLREERDPEGGQNLDFYSWMPEMQEGFT